MKFENISKSYTGLIATARMRPSAKSDAMVARIEAGRNRYQAVADQVGSIPWQVVGILHAMESGCNFSTHLHNGDPLTAKTVRVPAGRPRAGKAPFGWEQSAVDALKMKKLHAIQSWTPERIAYTFEQFNGFGYRQHRAINSPYLWAGSSHYTRGKYVSDGKYSANAVSKQIGAMVLFSLLNAEKVEQVQTVKNPHSEIMPLYRPNQLPETTRAVLGKFIKLTPADRWSDSVRVLAVRGYYRDSMGKVGANDRAIYDDAYFVVCPDGVQAFNGNSDPSVWRPRVASIKAPQAIEYRPGLHGYSRRGGPYPAFRQHSKCTVVRDGAGDDTGMFHVNLHRGGDVSTDSLGCLTVPPHQWDEFRDLVNGLLKKHDQETFFVTLLEYDGSNPPVSVTDINVARNPDKMTTEDGAWIGAIFAAGLAAWGWAEEVQQFISGVFV